MCCLSFLYDFLSKNGFYTEGSLFFDIVSHRAHRGHGFFSFLLNDKKENPL
jgi:hypothetical protein